MTETNVKIRFKFSPPYSEKKIRPGHCKLCGAKLTNPNSLNIGYGHRCYKRVPVIIILDIPGEKK